ncbi:uncharacterized protein LOC143290771 [Babylonia areolata]|uniref:uncharacterized protein LOC143290771 n=1 Tax=Babylonia areolata TaxID=304850 RepID=UPI003FD31A5B
MAVVVLMMMVVTVMGVGAWPPTGVRQDRNPPTRCIPPSPCFPSRQAIAEFAANISGSVYQPSDAEYTSLVSSANQRLTRHPALVVKVATESDVQEAVLFARKYHLALTVAATSGDFTRGSYGDASLQINLSELKTITTDVNLVTNVTDPGTITAQPGATWPQLIAQAASVGRDVVGQGYWDLPIGEQTQAGGYGPLSRSLGLFADNLVSARMVTMGGSVVEVSEGGARVRVLSGPSYFSWGDFGLWRAIRGGGAANFGIVTSYTFRMHLPLPYVTQVSASYLLYQNEQFVGRAALEYLLPLVSRLPSQWGGMVFLDGRSSPSTVGQKGLLSIELLHYGPYNSASYLAVTDLLDYDANGARVSLSVVNRTNVGDFSRNVGVTWPSGPARSYGFNTLLPSSALTQPDTLQDLVDTLLLVLNDPAVNAQYMCVLQPLGGAISSINSTAYVTKALRTAAMSVDCQLTWSDDDAIRDDVFLSYAIDFSRRLKAFGTGTSLGLGFFEDEENWKQTLYGDNYKELMKVKAKYDVDNYLWCHNCVASDYRLDCRRGCEKYEDERRAKRLEKMSEENERRILKFLGHDEQ